MRFSGSSFRADRDSPEGIEGYGITFLPMMTLVSVCRDLFKRGSEISSGSNSFEAASSSNLEVFGPEEIGIEGSPSSHELIGLRTPTPEKLGEHVLQERFSAFAFSSQDQSLPWCSGAIVQALEGKFEPSIEIHALDTFFGIQHVLDNSSKRRPLSRYRIRQPWRIRHQDDSTANLVGSLVVAS